MMTIRPSALWFVFLLVLMTMALHNHRASAFAPTNRHKASSGCEKKATFFATQICSRSAIKNNEGEQLLAEELERCNGEIIDPHLHTAPWFDTGEALVQGLRDNDIAIGLLYNPYPSMPLPYDINEYVTTIAANSNHRVYALASLNTTHDNWDEHREAELARLAEYLEHDVVLGAKLAPPNTCLPLTSRPVQDVVEVVNNSRDNKKVLAIHIGTTPFCGPMGQQFNIKCCCGREYVDPALLIPLIEQYPQVQFALLHSGHEFLPPDSEYFYNFEFVDTCIALAAKYPNVWLSLSAMFAQEPKTDGDDDGGTTPVLRYPGGAENCRKLKAVAHKVFWASDASWRRDAIRPVLITAIQAMRDAGFTESERTWSLNGCARHVFNIPATTTLSIKQDKTS